MLNDWSKEVKADMLMMQDWTYMDMLMDVIPRDKISDNMLELIAKQNFINQELEWSMNMWMKIRKY